MDEVKQNLFTVLERGDRKIDFIKKKAIMMVGLTRVGKSCTFNWILNKPMQGEGDQIEAVYKTINKDASSAELGDEYTSVTLIPNSSDIDSETSLVDMAGFGDTRNYIGVMGVSYFLKSVFEKAEQVKFLIVFNEHNFFETTGASIIKTFQGFLNMFHADLLKDKVIKDQIFDSISLVITRSKKPELHHGFLNKVITKINNPLFKSANKEMIIELVNYMLVANRIHAFQSAKPNQNPLPCDLFPHLEALNWKYVNIKEIEEQIKRARQLQKIQKEKVQGKKNAQANPEEKPQSLITIPFETDFATLQPDQKEQLNAAIADRVKTYSNFSSILKELLSSLKNNWKQTVQPEEGKPIRNLPDNFMDSVLSFQNVFKALNQFLLQSDKYNSENLITPQIRAEYPRLNLVQSIQNVLNIYKVADIDIDEFAAFDQNMSQNAVMFENLAECIRPFCSNAEEQKMVLRLKFILKRGFKEFAKFNDITPAKVAAVKQNMKDSCNNTIFSDSANVYVGSFIKYMNSDLMTRIFTTVSSIEKYEQLFDFYRDSYKPGYSDTEETIMEKKLEFNGDRININYVKADIYMKQGDRSKAGISFVEVLKLLCDQGEMTKNLGSVSLEQKLNNIFLMKLKVVDKLMNILVAADIRKYQNAKDHAISLCKYFNEIDAACEVYELQLEDHKGNNVQLCDIYKNYADYCILWGRYPDAKKLLQKKLRLENFNYETRVGTINLIFNLAEDSSRMSEDEKKRILQLQTRRPEKDDELQGLLSEIAALLQRDNSLNMSVGSTGKSTKS